MGWNVRLIVLTTIGFGLYFLLQESLFTRIYKDIFDLVHQQALSYFLTYLLVGGPVFVIVWLLHGSSQFFPALGLDTGFFKGLAFAAGCTLPMLCGYAIVFEFDREITFNRIMTGAVAAGFFEELYYRGFLFGHIFRFTRFGFIPAILISALIFASVHLYQSQDPLVLAGIFMTTFAGGIFFAWAYIEWHCNLWVPVFLHLLMNLFWMLFSAGDNALGNFYANIFRILTIALVIFGTIICKKRNGWKFLITKDSLWLKNPIGVERDPS